MGVVAVKAAAITRADLPSLNQSNARVIRGRVFEGVGTVEVTNGDDIGSVYRLCRVRSNMRISQVLLSCDAITSAAADFGVYKTARDGGAVVDADFIASAQSIASALIQSDITHEADAADAAAGFGRADVEKALWEALGLTSDPGIDYDIAATLTAAATATGTLSLRTRYTE